MKQSLCTVFLASVLTLASAALAAQSPGKLLTHPELGAEENVKLFEGRVSKLIENLYGGDVQECALARSALSKLDPIPEAVVFAFAEVALRGPEDAEKIVEATFTSGNVYSCRRLLEQLGDSAKPVVKPVAGLLVHEKSGVRYSAALLLMDLGDVASEYRPNVLKLREDESEAVRLLVESNLCVLGVPFVEARETYQKALKEGAQNQKVGAMRGIGQYGEAAKEMASELKAFLSDPRLRSDALGAICKLGNDAVASVVESMIDVWNSSDPYDDYLVRNAIKTGLIQAAETISSDPEKLARVFELIDDEVGKAVGGLFDYYSWYLTPEQKKQLAKTAVRALTDRRVPERSLRVLRIVGADAADAAPDVAAWIAKQTWENVLGALAFLREVHADDEITFNALRGWIENNPTTKKSRGMLEPVLQVMGQRPGDAAAVAAEWLASTDESLKKCAVGLLCSAEKPDAALAASVAEVLLAEKEVASKSRDGFRDSLFLKHARVCFEALTRLGPVLAYNEVSSLLEKAGDGPEAVLAFDVLAQLAPSYAPAKERLLLECDGPLALLAVWKVYQLEGDKDLLDRLPALISITLAKSPDLVPAAIECSKLLPQECKADFALTAASRLSTTISSYGGDYKLLAAIRDMRRESPAAGKLLDALLADRLSDKREETKDVWLLLEAIAVTGGMSEETRGLAEAWLAKRYESKDGFDFDQVTAACSLARDDDWKVKAILHAMDRVWSNEPRMFELLASLPNARRDYEWMARRKMSDGSLAVREAAHAFCQGK